MKAGNAVTALHNEIALRIEVTCKDQMMEHAMCWSHGVTSAPDFWTFYFFAKLFFPLHLWLVTKYNARLTDDVTSWMTII